MAQPGAIDDIIEFWFSERVRPLWFRATPELDSGEGLKG